MVKRASLHRATLKSTIWDLSDDKKAVKIISTRAFYRTLNFFFVVIGKLLPPYHINSISNGTIYKDIWSTHGGVSNLLNNCGDALPDAHAHCA